MSSSRSGSFGANIIFQDWSLKGSVIQETAEMTLCRQNCQVETCEPEPALEQHQNSN